MKPKSVKTENQKLKNKIWQETKIFRNIHIILEKVEQDGYFDSLFDTFKKIFSEEIHFALTGHLTRAAQTGFQTSLFQPQNATDQQHLHFQRKRQTDHQQTE